MKIVPGVAITPEMLTATDAEEPAPEWSGASEYQIGDQVQLAAARKIYQSLSNENSGNDPADADSEDWQEVGFINPWKMFDQRAGQQTSRAESLSVTLSIPAMISTLALLNISAAVAHVKVTAPDTTVVYEETHQLVSDSGITDFWPWFFYPIERKADLLVEDFPPVTGGVIEVTMTLAGGNVKVGEMVVGLLETWGVTQYGFGLDLISFGEVSRDMFGNAEIVKRGFVREGSFPVQVKNSYLDQLRRRLGELLDSPLLFIGAAQYDATLIFGFFRRSRTITQNLVVTLLSLDVEGL